IYAPQNLPGEDGAIKLTANKPFVGFGAPITIHWEISENSKKIETGWIMQITLPEGVVPSRADSIYFKDNIGSIPVETPTGELTVEAQPIIFDSYPITFDLIRKNNILYSNSLIMYPSTQIGETGGEVVSQGGRIKIIFPEKSFLENVNVVVSQVQAKVRFDLGASNSSFVIQAFTETGEVIQNAETAYQIQYKEFPTLPNDTNSTLPFHWYDPITQTWEEFKTDVDSSTNALIASTDRLGIFGFLESGPQEEELGFKIDANPGIYIPGKPIRLGWTVKGFSTIKAGSLTQVIIWLPKGVLPVEADLAAKVADDGLITISVDQPYGSLTLQIEPEVILPMDIKVQLQVDDQIIYDALINVTTGQFPIDRDAGGTINVTDKKVKIAVPSGASNQSLVINVRYPSPHKLPGYSLTWEPIEILAVDSKMGENITKFNKPITLQIGFDEGEIYGWAEEDLKIFFYDEEMADWYPVPTIVDTESNTLTAQVDHLSIWDFKASSWQGYSVPTVDTFQVSNFTGAGTYSLSLWTPSGSAGFQPDLTLSYNSQVIDEGSAFTQASWVGMGWSLDFGSITRNMHGTNSSTNDDTFNISAGGISGLLLPISIAGTVTTYNTADQSYLKVEFDSATNIWKAWSKDGYIYTFDQMANTHTINGCITSAGSLNLTWRWSLGTKTDKYGNAITYSYVNETKSSTCVNVVAAYPNMITYPNNRYRIEFIVGDRHDYQSAWTANESTYLYTKKRLTEIRIKNNTTGDWNAATTIRKYVFNYAADGATSNVVYPKLSWTGGTNARTSTLLSIQELSGDGTSSLPATMFYYEDSMHLTKVNNGRGGQVQMAYERWAYFDDINDSTRSLYTAFGQLHQECDPIDGLGTAWIGVVNPSYVRCDGSILYLQVGQDPNMSIGHRAIPENVIKPGSQYRFAIYVRALQGTTDTNWGFIDTSTSTVRM
ncbi:MAG: hypothetical protein ACYC00_23000, partial [Eubacteriales bacterium]